MKHLYRGHFKSVSRLKKTWRFRRQRALIVVPGSVSIEFQIY